MKSIADNIIMTRAVDPSNYSWKQLPDANVLHMAHSPTLGVYVAFFQGKSGISFSFSTSSDGENWTPRGQQYIFPNKPDFIFYPACLGWFKDRFITGDYSGNIFTSIDGITWNVAREEISNNSANSIRGIAASSNTVAILAHDYTVQGLQTVVWTSNNGINWTRTAIARFKNILTSNIQWTGTQFVIIGENSLILTSTNATAWTVCRGGREVLAAAYSPTLNILVSVGTYGIETSSDQGATWVKSGANIYHDLNSVIWSDRLGRFIAVGYQAIASSTDGLTWTQADISYNFNLLEIAESPTALVAVGDTTSESGIIFVSSNGVNWSFIPHPTQPWYGNTTDNKLHCVTWYDTNDFYIGASPLAFQNNPCIYKFNVSTNTITQLNTSGLYGNGAVKKLITLRHNQGQKFLFSILEWNSGIFYTQDLSNWSQTQTSIFNNPEPNYIIPNAGTLIIGSAMVDNTDGRYEILDLNSVSTNLNWLQFVGINGVSSNRYLGLYIKTVIYTGTKYIALTSSGATMHSTDLANWIYPNLGSYLSDVTGNSTSTIIVGQVSGTVGTILESTNGITFTERQTISGNYWHNCIWDGTQFIINSYGGAVCTSPNGITWTMRTTTVAGGGTFFEILWTGSKYVAIGGGSNIVFTSSNLTNWTAVLSRATFMSASASNNLAVALTSNSAPNVKYSLDGIIWKPALPALPSSFSISIWTGTQFLILRDRGEVYSSTDALTWTKKNTNATTSVIYHATTGAGILVGCSSNQIFSSSDQTISWTSRFSNTSYSFRSIAFGNGTFVVVGDSGIILSSADGITWTQRTSGTVSHIRSVRWIGTMFVVAGHSILLTSTDGITWTPRGEDVLSNFRPNIIDGTLPGMVVIFSDDYYSRNKILTSIDGTSWTICATDIIVQPTASIFFKNKFITSSAIVGEFSQG